ncbi:MAG: enoyl-ACP reductase FabI [Nitrospiria bacterium]
MSMLRGKKAIIFGVANERSIAWGIAQALHREGAELAFTFVGEAIEKRVRPLAESLGSKIVIPCDVSSDQQIASVFQQLRNHWDSLDIVAHSVAFARKEELKGSFMETSREGFRLALDISAYSLVAIAREAVPMMKSASGGSIITLSYFGAEKVIPHYNVMGVAKSALEASVRALAVDLGPKKIRVNAISPGPIKTLAASGISDFKVIGHHVESRAPLGRIVTIEEVGNTALFLCSPLASGTTGEVLHVDGGYNIIGM